MEILQKNMYSYIEARILLQLPLLDNFISLHNCVVSSNIEVFILTLFSVTKLYKMKTVLVMLNIDAFASG